MHHGKERRTPECKNPKVLDSILKGDLIMLVSRQIASFFSSCFSQLFTFYFRFQWLEGLQLTNTCNWFKHLLTSCHIWLFPPTLFITHWLVFWDNPSKVLYYLSNNHYPVQTSLLPPGKHFLHCHLSVDKWTSVSVHLAHDPLNKKKNQSIQLDVLLFTTCKKHLLIAPLNKKVPLTVS